MRTNSTSGPASRKPKAKARPKKLAPDKRRRDKEASKESLLRAAVEVFATRGYDAATTREIAVKAGVAEGLIHRYYESKAGLLIAVLSDFQSEQIKCSLDMPPPGAGLEAEVAAHLEAALQEMQQKSSFARVVMSRSIVDPQVARQMGKYIFEEKLPVVVERLRHIQATGEIAHDVDIQGLAFLISSTAFSLNFIGHIVFGLSEERARELAALMARLVTRGCTRTP